MIAKKIEKQTDAVDRSAYQVLRLANAERTSPSYSQLFIAGATGDYCRWYRKNETGNVQEKGIDRFLITARNY